MTRQFVLEGCYKWTNSLQTYRAPKAEVSSRKPKFKKKLKKKTEIAICGNYLFGRLKVT